MSQGSVPASRWVCWLGSKAESIYTGSPSEFDLLQNHARPAERSRRRTELSQ